ncbi:Hypothetical predicted protein [Scomber scombrus]|uniref:Uncharacterized protein n=1 Tax=Scomber scombrus TaxID=13677 RepID=A0AAV1NT52_SCOSC
MAEDLWIWVRKREGGPVTAGLNYGPGEMIRYKSIKAEILTSNTPDERYADCTEDYKTCKNNFYQQELDFH